MLFSLQINLLGEIISADGFEVAGPLYVKYTVDLPDLWELESKNECLSGTTVSSYCKESLRHFNHPLDLSILCRDTLTPPSWPKLNIVIYSIDYWNRIRIEGYCTITFPKSAGRHFYSVNTWKPIETRVNTLSNYFLGGSTYLNLSEMSIKDRINRYGFYTETSGSIKLVMNPIFSSESLSTKSDVDNSGGNHNLAVLSTALSRAKARLLALKSQEI